MFYAYPTELRRVVPPGWSTVLRGGRGGQIENTHTRSTEARATDTDSRQLLTDGGEEDAEGDESETDDSSGDEEMAPPERGDAGEEGEEEAEGETDEAEGEQAEEDETEEDEGEVSEEEEAEDEGETADEEAAEDEGEAAEEEAEKEGEVEAEGEAEEEGEADEGVVDVPQSDIESVGATEDESTTVVFLDLYGLDLDLLGLNVELHQLVLDVFATEGDGNLLGNLLSTVAGLTNPGGLSNLMPDVSEMMPEGGLSGMLPSGGAIKNALGLGGQAGEEGEGEEGEEGGGFLSSTASKVRDSVPSLPVKQLLIEVIAGVIRQLLESPEKESGEDASGEGS